jgi:hypothetical protein
MSLGLFATRDLHVSATDRECVRHVLGKLAQAARFDRKCRKARHKLLRAAITAHHNHQRLVYAFGL